MSEFEPAQILTHDDIFTIKLAPFKKEGMQYRYMSASRINMVLARLRGFKIFYTPKTRKRIKVAGLTLFHRPAESESHSQEKK